MDENSNEIIRRQTKALTIMFLIILLLLLIICLLMFCKISDTEMSESKKSGTIGFCGTQVLEESGSVTRSRITGLIGNFEFGKKLFKQNCAVCHSLTDQELTGPGLKGLYDRIPKPQIEWLKKYILNSEKVKMSGDAYSLMLQKKYKERSDMTIFEGQLSDKEINDLMYFLLGH